MTRHEDGVRPETDSDHTVMLGIIACAWADRCAPHLDKGLIAQFALVHDLVEAYSGDVMSLGMSPETRKNKEQREHEAFLRIKDEFKSLPWITRTIEQYESLSFEEARFVKILDKVMPKLTHLLNHGAALREHGISVEKAHNDHLRQRSMMMQVFLKTAYSSLVTY
jgi:putative hydrolase of HD superfamily